MKPYQIINCILQTILSEEVPYEVDHLVFDDTIRWVHEEDNLVYSKFELSDHEYYDYKKRTWRDVHKDNNSTRLDSNLINIPEYRILPHVVDHSYEPVDVILDKKLWDPQYKRNRRWPRSSFESGNNPDYKYDNYNPEDYPLFVLHSEHNSKDIEQLDEWTYKPIHWFSHAYLCSEFYFKHYPKLSIVTDYTARPIRNKWICANRLLRQHRVDLLEQIDLSKGCYSLTNPDPNGQIYTGSVASHSFDEHINSSAEIDIRGLNHWNTAFLHIVSETVWQDKIHFTEKIFKPIVLHQPFVVLQAPGSLEYLKSYGFKTFDKWWDESYDNIQDPKQRLSAIAKIIDDIGNKNLDELEAIRMEMASVLEYNFSHFYENIPAIVLSELRNNIRLMS